MRGQAQLVIFVSSLGVRRSELRPSAGAHSQRVVAHRPQTRSRAPSQPATENSDTKFEMTGSDHERSRSICAHRVFAQ
ncbi:jg20330 [Pararge aegeria aegeria]|uniref:Jg20330 protein n=1 Tax=Pararge aegeria aegeria TaxID=348720 RepID=A0A8S4REM3_9NEOP|nr:jg20330 [Pararge aegeria aegeria]